MANVTSVSRVPRRKQAVLFGAIMMHEQLTNFEFRPEHPYGGCKICGAVFQSAACRNDATPYVDRVALVTEWRTKHAKTHTSLQHAELANSGMWALPQAQMKLAPFGIVPMSAVSVTRDAEADQALLEAPRAPIDDAES